MTDPFPFTKILEMARAKYDGLQSELDTVKEQRNDYSRGCAMRQHTIDAQAETIREKDKTIAVLESRLFSLRDEIERLKAISCSETDMGARLEAKDSLIASKDRLLADYKARNDSQNNSIRVLQNEINTMRVQMKTMRDKLQVINNMTGDA